MGTPFFQRCANLEACLPWQNLCALRLGRRAALSRWTQEKLVLSEFKSSLKYYLNSQWGNPEFENAYISLSANPNPVGR
jgi:hypothetical protein